MKRQGDLDISVSAYPEKHPESPDFATDIDMLKRKVDNGATRAITQFFFDNDLYERYVERARRAGIYIPIVPGVLPIHNFTQVANLPGAAAPAFPAGLQNASPGSKTSRRYMLLWPLRSLPNRCSISWSAALTTSISTQ